MLLILLILICFIPLVSQEEILKMKEKFLMFILLLPFSSYLFNFLSSPYIEIILNCFNQKVSLIFMLCSKRIYTTTTGPPTNLSFYTRYTLYLAPLHCFQLNILKGSNSVHVSQSDKNLVHANLFIK